MEFYNEYQFIKETYRENVWACAVDFESEEHRKGDPVTAFYTLVKNGKFVEAIEVIHGNGSFIFLYTVFDTVFHWIVQKLGTSSKNNEVQQPDPKHMLLVRKK